MANTVAAVDTVCEFISDGCCNGLLHSNNHNYHGFFFFLGSIPEAYDGAYASTYVGSGSLLLILLLLIL